MSTKQEATKKAATKDWGFFIYIAGDNNLSDNGLEDISELCEVGSSPAVHAGVEIDTYGEHTGSIRYEITEKDWTGEAHRTVIARLPEKDSGNPATLTNFAKWALHRYPATHRLLVVWNHGSGFRTPSRSRRKDIAFDDFGGSLDMPEVESALNRAGIGTGKKYGRLSALGFDACLMCMVEIAHHFKDVADYIVGSEQTEPGDGWPYNKVLELLHGSPTPEALGQGIVDAYIQDYIDTGVQDVTQSAIATAMTPATIAALSGFGTALVKALPTERAAIRTARSRVQSYEYADYVDMIHLARETTRACNSSAVQSAAANLEKAARSAIVHSRTNGSTVANSFGLSMWFPPDSGTFLDYRAKYLRLKCNQGGNGWVNFLEQYFA